jgi:hypothetical protein
MNKTRVFELKIEDDDELSGIDSISLVDEPAIEVNWIAFKKEKQQEFHIPEGQDDMYLEKLMKYGQPEEELLDNGWVIQKENFVSSSPNSESVEDTSKYLIRYKYIKNPEAPGASVKETTRDFCRVLLNKNFVYRVEDLLNIINDEGKNAADWRGGYNCRHIWQQITYYNDGNKIVNKGSVTKNRVDGMESLDVFGDPQNDTRTSNPSFSKEKFESYSDYPESVKNNAKAVLKYVEENGWGSCGTDVGKQRANQLAKGEPISEDTIKRMYSYLSRHAGDLDSSKGYGDGCGKLMYDSWGGKSALSWAESKVKQFGYDNNLPSYVDELPKKKKDQKFAVIEDGNFKKIVLGPAMIPDQRIFRTDDLGNPYYVFFSPSTIRMIAEKYMRNKYTDNNDLMHDGQAVKDIHVLESWIVEDPEHDKAKNYGFDVPAGTWMISMKVNNPNVWEQIKEKKLNGFSVSGFFEEVAAFCREEMFLKQVVKILKNIED